MSDAWKLDPNAAAYLPVLAAAEDRFAIPRDLLARIAFQECSWRPEVIDYSVKSSAGAIGIMQLIPRFFPAAGVTWQGDVSIAGDELARLHDHFDDWQLAIAAYNWGQGDVDRTLKLDAHLGAGKEFADLPTETQNYVTGVFTDVPMPGAFLNPQGQEAA